MRKSSIEPADSVSNIEPESNKKWHSTETSLISTTDSFLHAIDRMKITAVVYLDMSKSFDNINHVIL